MKRKLEDFYIQAVTEGTRPIRILIFGGTIMALLILMGLAKIFNIDIDIGKDIRFSHAILIVISILVGFSASFGIVHGAELLKRRRDA